jgi:hypothetical protein
MKTLRHSEQSVNFHLTPCRELPKDSLLMLLVPGFSQQRSNFDPSTIHVGFVVDKVAMGQVSSNYFGFLCHFTFHRLLQTHLPSGADTMRPLVADVPSGLSFIPPHTTN